MCEHGDHAGCPHWSGTSQINLFRRGDRFRTVELCGCECHKGCPMADKEQASTAAWLRDCTCPGASAYREIEEESEREAAARRDAASAVSARASAESDPEYVRADLAGELSRRGIAASEQELDFGSKWIVASHRKDNIALARLTFDFARRNVGLFRAFIRDVRRPDQE